MEFIWVANQLRWRQYFSSNGISKMKYQSIHQNGVNDRQRKSYEWNLRDLHQSKGLICNLQPPHSTCTMAMTHKHFIWLNVFEHHKISKNQTQTPATYWIRSTSGELGKCFWESQNLQKCKGLIWANITEWHKASVPRYKHFWIILQNFVADVFELDEISINQSL